MMVFAWTRSMSGVYPTLWYTAPPARGEGEPDSLRRIVQSHLLTEEQERELDRMPDGVSRIDTLAKTFPYNVQEQSEPTVDTVPLLDMLNPAIDAAVDAYRQRMRKHDGQSVQIDRENTANVPT